VKKEHFISVNSNDKWYKKEDSLRKPPFFVLYKNTSHNGQKIRTYIET